MRSMSKQDRRVSAEAWESLVDAYEIEGGTEADDHVLAQLLHEHIWRVEG